MSDELKACPFCGGEAEIEYCDPHCPCGGTVRDVHCVDCYASIVADSKAETVKLWNSRHEVQRIADLEAKNKQLKHALGHTEAALADWGDTGIDELRLKVTDLEAELAKYRKALQKIQSYTKFGTGSISKIRGIIGSALELPDQKEREE